jgi:hypothetical protein
MVTETGVQWRLRRLIGRDGLPKAVTPACRTCARCRRSPARRAKSAELDDASERGEALDRLEGSVLVCGGAGAPGSVWDSHGHMVILTHPPSLSAENPECHKERERHTGKKRPCAPMQGQDGQRAPERPAPRPGCSPRGCWTAPTGRAPAPPRLALGAHAKSVSGTPCPTISWMASHGSE